MPKHRKTIRTSLPPHNTVKRRWRRAIRDSVVKAANRAGVIYGSSEPLEVAVLVYLSKGKAVSTRDVDNLVKHVLDAFQGRFGSVKGKRRLIENDNLVYRLVVEKRNRPKHLTALYGGKLLIRRYQKGRWP